MNIADFDYPLPEERIAKFPTEERDASKLLLWRAGDISETCFRDIACAIPSGSLLVFNNTRVVRARLVMHKPVAGGTTGVTSDGTKRGARIELLCLEPRDPSDYEHAFSARKSCEWLCMVGNLKKWSGMQTAIEISFTLADQEHKLQAWRKNPDETGARQIVRFRWDADITFGQLLELLGRVPIPPYLGRDSHKIDQTRYQTVYSRFDGSVAAPTAGLHFTPELIDEMKNNGIAFDEVTLHVGAGTFLPVKVENALDHPMHTEHFEVTLRTIEHLIAKSGSVVAVGTTSVRTLESLVALGHRIAQTGGMETGSPDVERTIGQFELYDIPSLFDGRQALETLAAWMRSRGVDKLNASTRIMITPGFGFRITSGIVTNFHQPKSTLLLLVSAFTGGVGTSYDEWRRIYDYALDHDFRFLSYGDSSLLLRDGCLPAVEL